MSATDHVIEWDMPEVPYSTIPCIERMLEYCDALDAVVSREFDTMPPRARQDLVDQLSELRGYIVEVVTAEIDELCDGGQWPNC